MKRNLRDALEKIAERCDEIVAVAEDDRRKLSELFTLKENTRSIGACLDLAGTLAGASVGEIRAARARIEKVRDRVMAANDAIEDQTNANPLVMSAVRGVQNIAFNGLLGRNEDVANIRSAALLVDRFALVVRTTFLALLVDVGRQIRKAERNRANAEVPSPTACGKGPKTGYMKKQLDVFTVYLRAHGSPGKSIYTLARLCWNGHRAEWDAAAADGIGYSEYRALARAMA